MRGTECATENYDKYYAKGLPALVRTERITEKSSNSIKITPLSAFFSIVTQRKMHTTYDTRKEKGIGNFRRTGGDGRIMKLVCGVWRVT